MKLTGSSLAAGHEPATVPCEELGQACAPCTAHASLQPPELAVTGMAWSGSSTGSHPAPGCIQLLHPHLGEQTQPIYPPDCAAPMFILLGAPPVGAGHPPEQTAFSSSKGTGPFTGTSVFKNTYFHLEMLREKIYEIFVYQQNLPLKNLPTGQVQTQKPHFAVLILNIHSCKPNVP